MKFISPNMNDVFRISAVPEWPSILFQTDANGIHSWDWSIVWGAFKKTGTASTPGNSWDAKSAVSNLGGTLTVHVQALTAQATVVVKLLGTNPLPFDVTSYLASKPKSDGFEKIIQHENAFKHFNAQNEPDKSFDNGYGLCQLTTPVPTFDQIWNWKHNVDAGLLLFADKVNAATAYLSQSGRAFTADQLKYESVSRWNGGSYHEWNTVAAKWVRKANVLCDSATGNIGWDMADAENKGKTEAQLHQRDRAAYRRGPQPGAHWQYFGVCYADSILG